jgi:murein DD-endopeptidase MepM/ murein hydrolase activator NlpD
LDARWRTAFLVAFVGLPQVLAAKEDCKDGYGIVCLDVVEREDSVLLSATNRETYDMTITVEAKLKNMTSSVNLPYTRALEAGFRQPIMTFLVNPRVASGWAWEYSFNCIAGSVNARHDDSVVYDLPYRGTHTVIQGFHGTFSHFGDDEYAVDFEMRVGTPVYAAREGIVVGTKTNSNQGGPDNKLANLANFIFIRHSDGTIAEYYHLRQGGAAVKVGDQVRRRQVIGYSGNTGFTSQPHLHFSIFRAIDGFSDQTFPMRFQTNTEIISPVEGRSYTSPP